MISHVLHPFQGEDKEKVQEALDQAADAVEAWMKGAAVGELMQQFNKKPQKAQNGKVPSEEAKENAQ